MKGKVLFAGIAGVASMVAVSSAMAAGPVGPFDPKLQASVYNTKLVQAEDECPGSGVTVIGGQGACAPANVATDGTQFSVGKLLLKSKGGPTQVLAILKSSGNGDVKKALAGKSLRVKLTLRITRLAGANPATSPAATWVDQELSCFASAVPSNGNWIFKGALFGATGCNLDTDLLDDSFQKEVVAAAIVDATSGKAVAVPGVRKK